MTDKIDTSPEAVERLANDMQVHMPWGRGANTLRALSARVAELEAANDAAEKSHRISDHGNLWRFWSDKAREMSSKFKALRKRAEAAEQRATTLEAKLAKAVDVDMIEQAINDVLSEDGSVREAADYVTRATLAEIKDG